MENLSDPVTVSRERDFIIHCIPDFVRRGGQAVICKPGNLLSVRDELPRKALTSEETELNPTVSVRLSWVGDCI